MDFQSQIMNDTVATEQYTADQAYEHAILEKNNPNQALLFFLQAAEKDHVAAMYEAALSYENGRGCDKNVEKAAHWFEEAATRGNTDAMFHLAQLYGEGIGRMDDACLEAFWYKKGAAMGHLDCLYHAGQCYLTGTGVPKNEAKGWDMIQNAANRGHEEARAYLEMDGHKAENEVAGNGMAENEVTGNGMAGNAVAIELLRSQIEQGILTVQREQRTSHRELLTALHEIRDLLAAKPCEVSTPAPKARMVPDAPRPARVTRKRPLLEEMEDVAAFALPKDAGALPKAAFALPKAAGAFALPKALLKDAAKDAAKDAGALPMATGALPKASAAQDIEFWDQPTQPAPQRPRHHAPRPIDSVGTLYRYHPSKIPRGSHHDHYTAVALKDGSVLQVKSLLGHRTLYGSVSAWLDSIPEQPAYEDLEVECK